MDLYTNEASLVDIERASRFESAWIKGSPRQIEEFLPPSEEPSYVPTLLCLIEIEMQWARKSAMSMAITHSPPRLIEDYIKAFKIIDQPNIIRRLLKEESQARRLYGSPPEHGEYRRRFPTIVGVDHLFEDYLQADSNPQERLPEIPNYQLLCRLGRGGMGQVYKGLHLRAIARYWVI
jgi:hypothetical protein